MSTPDDDSLLPGPAVAGRGGASSPDASFPGAARRDGRRAAVRTTAGVLATTVLFALSFPPHGSPLVAWTCLVPLLLVLRVLPPLHCFLVTWLSGLTMAYAITRFLPDAVAVYYGQGRLFGALLFVASVSAMCCVSHVLFGLWYRRDSRRETALSPLAVGAAWVVAEFVRGDLEGNPWGTLGYTQAGVLPVVQVAEWTGVYGVSFLVVAVNAALAQLAAAVAARRPARAALGGLAIAAALAAAAFVHGSARLPGVEAATKADVPVAIVQGNEDLGARWRREFYGATLEGYLRQTAGALRESPPAIVFWPENALTFFLADEPLYRDAIGQALSPAGSQLVTGGPFQEADRTRVYNSAFLLAPDGGVRGRYDKRVLMPFAEYYPRWFHLFRRRSFDEVEEFTPGPPSPPLATAAGPAAVVTCNEALFPRTVAGRIAEGGAYIVNLANDAWLGVHEYSDRVLDFAVLRAIEQRRFVVRASTSGGSALIAPSGRVLARSRPFEAEVLRGSIAPSDERTPYGRAGDWFVGLCALSLAFGALRARR